jgi:hypothetical protein
MSLAIVRFKTDECRQHEVRMQTFELELERVRRIISDSVTSIVMHSLPLVECITRTRTSFDG